MSKNNLFKRLIDHINSVYSLILRWGIRAMYRKQYSSLLSKHPQKSLKHEDLYIKKWRKLDCHPDISTYRLFSQYIGEDTNIAPEDIVAEYIQPILNPIEYRGYYQDKNMFEKIIPKDYLPTALLRGIRGFLYDKEYNLLDNLERKIDEINTTENVVFLKPSVDSSSGKGVIGFKSGKDGKLYSLEGGILLNESFVNNYIQNNPDFILQRGLTQHPYINQFNPTSINTIRVATYKSVKDGAPHFLNAIIRIGKIGTYLDNAHAGGLFVGIDHLGKLGKYACDQFGNKYDEFNGIDFSKAEFIIPNFQKVINFAQQIASYCLHAGLIAHDICIQEDGSLKIVEFNIRGFSSWLFQFTCGSAFGKWTDEIIDYCALHKNKATKVYVEAF